MIILKSCPVCSSRSVLMSKFGTAPTISHEIMPGVKVEAAIVTHFFYCQNCHVFFQNPRMTDQELKKFYKEGYYRNMIGLTEEEMDQDELGRAEFDAKIIKENLGEIESHLDIGASRGYLLDKVAAKLRVGVESNTDYIKAKGIKVYREISQVPQKSFALVSAIHTLEHVPDPISYLKEMVKKVSQEGYLVIEVPTWKSPGGPLRLAHLYHFEPDVLRLMCKQVGLRVMQTEFTPHLLLICRL